MACYQLIAVWGTVGIRRRGCDSSSQHCTPLFTWHFEKDDFSHYQFFADIDNTCSIRFPPRSVIKKKELHPQIFNHIFPLMSRIYISVIIEKNDLDQ